ncbi:tRNA (guanine-N(7)-)-methyltransferase non-catalytic subunit trm82 [Marasmius crinis-equi]|uniref:tRNA (Guanine-N(7)-)-methyltransferase non-catalytic subunit trm82 n=1 Tax=Marasmius crinis-equi TaxID=585013 RepID=A0ABR3ETU9_9AGAR
MSESHFPHSLLLFSDSGKALVASGQHIQLLDTRTGDILSSTVNAPDEVKKSLLKSGHIRFIAFDKAWNHLLTFSDDKNLKVWKVEGLELLHERELPKRPTSACFTADGQTIVVADKFGDVFSYPLHPAPAAEAPSQPQEDNSAPAGPAREPDAEPEQTTGSKRKRKSKKNPNHHENPPHARDSVESHTNTSGGTLILGHTSLLTSCLFSQDQKYIITTDRDEHIRVSWYPQGYVIETFCLGCSRFVSCLHIPKSRPAVLISGGGDPEIKLWDWHSGKLLHDVPILDRVKEYIQVKAQPYVRKRSRGKNTEDDPMNGEREAGGDTPASESGTPAVEEPPSNDNEEETILVVNKIETVEREGKSCIVFSVNGATAIFATPFPEATNSSSPPTIQALDFGHPVLDFTLDSNGLVWVTIDRNLTKGSVSWEGKTIPDTSVSASTQPQTRLVEIKGDSSILEVSSVPEPCDALLNALNATCLVAASSEDLSTLNLYSSLTSLPKNNRGGEDEEGGDEGEQPQGQSKQKQKQKQQSKRDLGPAKGRKEEGKMKSKMAVLERQKQLQSQGEGASEANETERETKRPRSGAEEAESEEVKMDES